MDTSAAPEVEDEKNSRATAASKNYGPSWINLLYLDTYWYWILLSGWLGTQQWRIQILKKSSSSRDNEFGTWYFPIHSGDHTIQ